MSAKTLIAKLKEQSNMILQHQSAPSAPKHLIQDTPPTTKKMVKQPPSNALQLKLKPA